MRCCTNFALALICSWLKHIPAVFVFCLTLYCVTLTCDPCVGRSYWVVDVAWTHDDLYVVCVTGQGHVCILTRLGEPALTLLYGMSLDMGPRFYLPLHPLVTVQ